MSTDKKTEEQKKTVLVAQQKLFKFDPYATEEQIDGTVNKWLIEQAQKGKPAMLGKTWGDNGTTYIVYMFTEKIPAP